MCFTHTGEESHYHWSSWKCICDFGFTFWAYITPALSSLFPQLRQLKLQNKSETQAGLWILTSIQHSLISWHPCRVLASLLQPFLFPALLKVELGRLVVKRMVFSFHVPQINHFLQSLSLVSLYRTVGTHKYFLIIYPFRLEEGSAGRSCIPRLFFCILFDSGLYHLMFKK